jgi:acetyl esterase/lipase
VARLDDVVGDRSASAPGLALVSALALVVVLVLVAGCGTTTTGAPAGTTIASTEPPPPPTTAVARLLACGTTKTFAYAEHAGVDPNLNSLDVSAPPAVDGGCAGRPLVVWVHGGGWTSGDKSEYMADKVKLFNGAGYAFATVNYRLTDKTAVPPAPQYPVHDQDTADAIGWLIGHADALGVDPDQVVLLGHSAGGGIVSAVATDGRYLARAHAALANIRCAGSLDGEGYDIVAGATTAPVEVQTGYRNAFGTDPAVWADASPIRHVQAGAGIPAFFVAARGSDWRFAQHAAFVDALKKAGVPTTVLDATALEHADLTTLVGAPGDTVLTPALMKFVDGCVHPTQGA